MPPNKTGKIMIRGIPEHTVCHCFAQMNSPTLNLHYWLSQCCSEMIEIINVLIDPHNLFTLNWIL